jgi:hypothetical protein
VNSYFDNPGNRLKPSQPMVQSLRSLGDVLPNVFLNLLPVLEFLPNAGKYLPLYSLLLVQFVKVNNQGQDPVVDGILSILFTNPGFCTKFMSGDHLQATYWRLFGHEDRVKVQQFLSFFTRPAFLDSFTRTYHN